MNSLVLFVRHTHVIIKFTDSKQLSFMSLVIQHEQSITRQNKSDRVSTKFVMDRDPRK